MEITCLLEFGSRSEWRSWLQNHHATESSCWLAIYRSKQPPRGMCLQYVDAVEEALCFGWIDSTLKSLHDGRLAQRFSPRRKNSHWTDLNLQRCRDLEKQGLMTEAGWAACTMLHGS